MVYGSVIVEQKKIKKILGHNVTFDIKLNYFLTGTPN